MAKHKLTPFPQPQPDEPAADKAALLDREIARLTASVERVEQRLATLRVTQDRARRRRREVLNKYVENLLPALTYQVYHDLLERLPGFMREPRHDELFDSVKPSLKNKLLKLVFVFNGPKALEVARAKLGEWLDASSYKNLSLPSCDPSQNSETIGRLTALAAKMTTTLTMLKTTTRKAKAGKINIDKVPDQSFSTAVSKSADDDDDSMLLYLGMVAALNTTLSSPDYVMEPQPPLAPGGGTFDGGGASGGWDSSSSDSSSSSSSDSSSCSVD